MAARRQQRASAEVREVRWQVSEHVGHLRKHPEEYTAALLGFLSAGAVAEAYRYCVLSHPCGVSRVFVIPTTGISVVLIYFVVGVGGWQLKILL